MKTIYALTLVLFLSLKVNAQNDIYATSQKPDTYSKPKENTSVKTPGESDEVKNIMSIKAGITDPFLAFTYERLFSQKVGAEVAIGLIGLSVGPKFYLPSIRPEKVNFHTGVVVGWGFFAQGMYGYLPIGINRLTKNNFMLSFDVGPQYIFEDEQFLPGINFRIGKAF
ncbi:hypothetical protein JYB62_13190 [Algoriphagus lutimaris]|uniref:hypothetical protein n=1 Tax=Algoriphagus lutimaris TaxID=613197 RepID=UPI00196A63FF|nr:hypothetical protein [Algoriphagus lutimaris]MBN3520957.1 hypothetical protein [Algoriphagus lutimaris]